MHWDLILVYIIFIILIINRWTQQTILLNNPTDEMLELVPTVSNTNNFSLERDNERPIVLRPRSQIEVPIHFMPSTLGQGDHIARIIFHSEQVSTKHVIH